MYFIGKILDADSEDLLAQEIDSIDSPMAGEAPKRPTALNLPSKPTLVDRRLVFNVTFGVPLFDAELNQEIIQKIVNKGLVATHSLDNMSETYENMGTELISFIRLVLLMFISRVYKVPHNLMIFYTPIF